MASTVSNILTDLGDAIRESGLCRQVAMGVEASTSVVPRAHVMLTGVEYVTSDDAANQRWGRLRAQIHLRWRAADAGDGQLQLAALAGEVTDALLADAYRGGLCSDLPLGRATEVTQGQPSSRLRRPEMELVLDVRCHFAQEAQEAQA